MPYNKTDELPQEIQEGLPQEAQQIFVAAFNASQRDGLSEDGARRVAWNSVNNQYEKGSDGQWHSRGEITAQHDKAVTSGGN
ncbi:ChaB family protein [Aetokthonos hydrillicola Thurmond2011]|uniref:ChaB family protein n=1 Tax=Aetokthonos hydrillicola Thurmond2011 TaxID=2712845 RepID=A0AAP5IAW1_9CYAN|nr:ChaB family protein [Aetokthonos hydrillicola]MBO3462044.1 cation transport regulator ChaB [Aetokthonos hydrillicola CCALA 1050]MBW4589349.1 ChaB family protein [Aetokthonos hydrillicola CCALA 1050]MDR9898118.1 ChaB family protein [Aetokthonos hydrillicola Thurmond2011]